jgi:hypothetical protein
MHHNSDLNFWSKITLGKMLNEDVIPAKFIKHKKAKKKHLLQDNKKNVTSILSRKKSPAELSKNIATAALKN